MTKVVKGMNKVVGRLGAITKRVAKVGLAAFGIALALTVREFVNFDQAITSSSAKFGDLNLATAKGQKQLKELGRIARDVGAATQFTATEAAQGLDFLAMAGFNVQQAMVGLPQVVDLATVGNIDLARATDISSDALGAFNLMVKDSTQLQINMTRINDVLAKTITSSNTNLETLFETIQKGAPSFTAAGQSIESFAALAGAMANAGVKGSVAGVALKNVMLKLASPTGEAAKILKTLGVRTQDSSGNFLDIIDILADFENGLKGMGNAQRLAALKAVFGERTITGINVLLATGSDALREYRESIKEATGAAKKMADIIRGTLMNRLKALKSAAIELGFKFIEGFTGKAGEAIKGFTEKLRKFDVESIVKGIGKAFKFLAPFLGAAVKGFGWMLNNMEFVIAGVWGLSFALQAVNVVMAANVVGAVILSLQALVLAIIIVIRYWDEITTALRNAWNWINNIFNNPVLRLAMMTFAQPLLFILGIIQTIVDLLSGKGWKSFLNMTGPWKAITDMLGITQPGGQWGAPISPNEFLDFPQYTENTYLGELKISGAPAFSTYRQLSKEGPKVTMPLGSAEGSRYLTAALARAGL